MEKRAENTASPSDVTSPVRLDFCVTAEDLVAVDEWMESGSAEVVLAAAPGRKRPASPALPQPVSKRHMGQAPTARECSASQEPTIVAPQHHPLQHQQLPGHSYASLGLDTLVDQRPWTIPPLNYEHHAHAQNSMMPFLPHMQPSMPLMFPQPQITAPSLDPRNFQLNLMMAEVQRLTAGNEVCGCGWRMAEQACDKLRRELEELKKTGAIKTLKERNVELLKSMEAMAQENSQLKEALKKKPNRDEVFNCVVLRSQISKLRQEKEAADDEIADLMTQLAAEQSKNATSSDAVKEEIWLSPASRDSTPELQNVATSIAQYDGNNNRQNLPATGVNTVTAEVLSPGSAAVPKGFKELTTYFRALEDHGLSPEEIVEYLRRKYPYMASNLFSLLQVVVAKSCYPDE